MMMSLYNTQLQLNLFFTTNIIYVIFRAVHGLVRVEFVPNSELTCRNRKGKKCTRRQPAGVIRSGSSNCQRVVGGLVGVKFEKTVRKWWKKHKSGEETQIPAIVFQILAIFPLDPMRFHQIWQKSHRIWWDFARSGQNIIVSKGNITEIWVSSSDSVNFGWDLEILAGI